MSDDELIWALKTGDLEEIGAKLITTEDVNRTLEGGRKPLHYAADCNQPEVVLFLLSKGAQIDAKDRHGFTPLLCACFESSAACVKVLLEKGADKDATAPDGTSAFEAAAESETIKAMLK